MYHRVYYHLCSNARVNNSTRPGVYTQHTMYMHSCASILFHMCQNERSMVEKYIKHAIAFNTHRYLILSTTVRSDTLYHYSIVVSWYGEHGLNCGQLIKGYLILLPSGHIQDYLRLGTHVHVFISLPDRCSMHARTRLCIYYVYMYIYHRSPATNIIPLKFPKDN